MEIKITIEKRTKAKKKNKIKIVKGKKLVII